MIEAGEVLDDLELRTAEGAPVQLSRFTTTPLVVQCLRYYG
ncbi:MAG: hypothetical protein ACRD0L_13090 [Acidimicrobiales bacterium]